jgi:hypothetical protein
MHGTFMQLFFMALATGRSIAGSRSDSHRARGLGGSANPTPAAATAHGHAQRDAWLPANVRNIHGGGVPRFILPSRMTSLCVDRIPDRRRSNDGSQRSKERGHFCGRFRQRPQHIDSTRFTTCVDLCRQKTSQRETRRRHSLRIYQQR